MIGSKERVIRSIQHRRTDRVPVDYWARNEVTEHLAAFLRVNTQEELYEAIGIDLRKIVVNEHWEGSAAWGVIEEQASAESYIRWVSGPFVGTDDLESFHWPGVHLFETVDRLRSKVDRFKDRYALIGEINLPFKACWRMRGFENFLCDMAMDPDFAGKLLHRVSGYETEKGLRLIRAGVDIIGIYGDLAMQDRMLMDPDLWRTIEKPILRRMISEFRSERPGISMFFHSDGDITEIIPDLIEIGIDIINPIQPECMDVIHVKRQFGDRITLHGTLSIQKTLPFGSEEDVEKEVRDRIETCSQDGGLILCPSNLLQTDTPLANILKIYETAGSYHPGG